MGRYSHLFSLPPPVSPETGGKYSHLWPEPAGAISLRELREQRRRELLEAGALPTEEIEEASGLMERPRTLGDVARRIGTSALSAPADYASFKEMAVRALTPERFEEPMVQALVGPEKLALDVAQRAVPALPISQERQAAERTRFRSLGDAGSPVGEALLDTAMEGAGLALDPANLIPTGAAARGAGRAAGAAADVATRGPLDRVAALFSAPLTDRRGPLRPASLSDVQPEGLFRLHDDAVAAGDHARARQIEELIDQRERALPARPGAYPGGPLPDAGRASALPAESLLPPGSPRAVGPTTVTPQFQSNLFAQVAEPEVRDYIVRRSDEIAQAIGGPQAWDEVEEMAVRLGTTKEEFLARDPRFALMSKEERARLTMVIKGNEEDIAGLQGRLAAGQATDEDKANLLRLVDQRGSLIKLAVGVGSEYGRALNSLKMEARASLGEATFARQALYRRYQDTIDKNAPMLDALARLDPENPEELQAFLRAVDKPRFREYVQEYWIGSVLSGPATQERNMIGNASNAITENFMVRPVRAVLDPAIARFQGRDREHFLREVPAAAVGMTHGIRKGLARGLEVLRRGYDVNGPGKLMPIRSAFGRSQNKFVREVVGPVATGSLRLLAAADAMSKTMNYTAEIYAQAANIAAREGLQGADFATRASLLAASPTEDMIASADAFALKATFNDEVSNIGKAWMGLRDVIPGGTFLSPFVKIADRLMARGFEYTPYGFVKAARASGPEVADQAARGAIGSAIMLAGASLAMDDRLTAGAPADPAERDAFYRAGKKPWAVKVDETWIPYGQMQPIATPLALVASFMQGWQDTGESPPEERVAEAASQVGRYVTDQSYMDSVAKFFAAVTGGQGAARAGADLLTQTVGGFMPLSGLSRAVAQAIDPRLVEARTVSDKLQSQVPGATLSLPARLDAWGEEIVPASGRMRGVLAAGTPLDASTEKPSPLDAELARLGMPLGFVDARLYDPMTRRSEKLSPQDHRDYQQRAGRKTKELLTELFSSPDYQQSDAEVQRKRTERAIGVARQYARMQLLAQRHGWQ